MRKPLAVVLTLIGLSLFVSEADAQTADELIARADAAVRAGNLDDGIRDATAAIKLDPKRSAAYRVRGHAYLKLVEKEERSKWLPELDKRYPKTANADNALADLAKAIELDPKDAQAVALRGGIYYFLNDLETAMVEYNRAAEMMPNERWYKNNYAAVRNRLASQYSIAGSNKRIAAERLAETTAKEKLLREGLAFHAKAIDLNPTVDNLTSRVSVLEELGEYEKAIADLDAAIRLKPSDHLNHWRRGMMYHKLKRYAEAVAAHREGLAQIERLTGDISLPQNDFRTEIAKNLALQGKFDEAFAMFDLALSVNRPSYITQYERGKAHLLKGDLERAEADLRKAMELGRGYQPAADELRKMGKTP